MLRPYSTIAIGTFFEKAKLNIYDPNLLKILRDANKRCDKYKNRSECAGYEIWKTLIGCLRQKRQPIELLFYILGNSYLSWDAKGRTSVLKWYAVMELSEELNKNPSCCGIDKIALNYWRLLYGQLYLIWCGKNFYIEWVYSDVAYMWVYSKLYSSICDWIDTLSIRGLYNFASECIECNCEVFLKQIINRLHNIIICLDGGSPLDDWELFDLWRFYGEPKLWDFSKEYGYTIELWYARDHLLDFFERYYRNYGLEWLLKELDTENRVNCGSWSWSGRKKAPFLQYMIDKGIEDLCGIEQVVEALRLIDNLKSEGMRNTSLIMAREKLIIKLNNFALENYS